MLPGGTNSEVLKSIQTQLNKFLYSQMARKAHQKVHLTKKLLNVYTYSSENVCFLIVFCICLVKQLISVNDIFPGFCFCFCFFFHSIKQILLLEIILESVALYFSLIPSQLELTFFGNERKKCSESGISTRISVNVV